MSRDLAVWISGAGQHAGSARRLAGQTGPGQGCAGRVWPAWRKRGERVGRCTGGTQASEDKAGVWRGSRGAGNHCGPVSGVGTVTKLCKLARAGQGVQQQESCAAQARRARGAPRRGGIVKDLGAAARSFLKCLSSAAASAPPPIALSPRPSRDTRAQTLRPSALSSRGHGCVSVMQAVTVCIWAHSSQAGAKRADRACHGPIGHPGAAQRIRPCGAWRCAGRRAPQRGPGQ